MVVIEGSDRSIEAKGETETEGCSGTIATVGAIKFKEIVHFFESRSHSMIGYLFPVSFEENY
jgi:hypothetical protein